MQPSAYGLFAATGCILAGLWLKGRRTELGLTENAFWAAMWTMVLGATVGAKALFVALGWEHYARGELRFWADFRVGCGLARGAQARAHPAGRVGRLVTIEAPRTFSR